MHVRLTFAYQEANIAVDALATFAHKNPFMYNLFLCPFLEEVLYMNVSGVIRPRKGRQFYNITAIIK